MRQTWLKNVAPVCALLAASAAAGLCAGATSVSIELAGGAFRVAGWSAPSSEPAKGWPSVLAVYAGAGNVPPLMGAYSVERGTLVFRPKYPFAAGMNYRAVFRQPGGGSPVEKTFAGPPRAVNPVARVEGVYPSGDVWPSNLLRIYIRFSAPMSKGESAAHMRFLDAKGAVLPGMFLPGEELWDPAGTRLTMTLDPGRLKRGLTSNMAMGAPIEPGKGYTLVIDKEWRDARGVAMVEGVRKQFRGGAADRVPPDPKTWKIMAPTAKSSDALVVSFGEPLNYALLQRMLRVDVGRGNYVSGTVAVNRGETEWRFVPGAPWRAGGYKLVVDTAIEDLAANRVGLAFDVDVFEHVTERIVTKTMALPFTVR